MIFSIFIHFSLHEISIKGRETETKTEKSIIEDGIELSKSTAVNEFVCVFAFFSYSFSNVNQIRAKKTQIFRFFSVTRFFCFVFKFFFFILRQRLLVKMRENC